MPARRRLATAVVVASLVVVSWTVPASAEETPADPVADLVDAADGPVDVQRDDTGTVTALVSQDGEAVLDTDASSPRAAVRELLAEHGEAFGVAGGRSSATVGAVLPSATGGSVVRAEQRVGGLPVFGGQLVTVLDEDDDVVSVAAATTDGDAALPSPRTTREQALATARDAVSGATGVASAALGAESLGSVVFDPALVGDGPGAPRPVWQVEVTGPTVRQTVLVGTEVGEVALRLDELEAVTSRAVCDNANQRAVTQAPPACTSPVRSEGGAPSGRAEVDAAYEHLGETADAFAALRPGTDLSAMLGGLSSTVRWCVSGSGCPYRNAFWNGSQVVLGDGFALADDVVAHELTHGYVEKTANLFYFQQSGALNEAFADVLGEIVDRRSGADADTRWTLGEDLTGTLARFRRDLEDPTLAGLPDRMGSPLWLDEHGFDGDDNGGVHHNMGVGLKTGYLVSQGGTFNGRTIRGIDAGDPSLAKTGLLYLELIPTLTSGADYADLGTALVSTCDRLATTATRGFTTADCTQVARAVAATELASPPTVGEQPVDVSSSCPVGSTQSLLARDDDGVATLFAERSDGSSAFRVPAGSQLQYAVSGAQSFFLSDPGATGAPVWVLSRALTLPTGRSGVYVHFDHARSFTGSAGSFADGGRVVVQRRGGSGGWETVGPLPWDNGPRQVVDARDETFTGFGGDSRGWGSSRLDLTSLAGQEVRLRFEVVGDDVPDGYGWWLDDVRVYTCGALAPALAATPSPTPTPTPTPSTTPAPVTPAPVTPAPVVRRAVTASVVSSATRVRKGRTVVVTGRAVVRGTTTAVRGVRMTLQQRVTGRSRWATVSVRTTDRSGTAAWTVKPRRATGYRVLVAPGSTTSAGTSAVRAVALAPGRR